MLVYNGLLFLMNKYTNIKKILVWVSNIVNIEKYKSYNQRSLESSIIFKSINES